MEGGGVPSIQDVWDWEVLPDEHRSFYAETRAASRAHDGGEVLAGKEGSDQPALDHDLLQFPLMFSSL